MNKIALIILASVFVCGLTAEAQKQYKRQIKKYKKDGVEKQVNVKSVKAEEVVTSARYFLGVKHKMGGTGHNGLDCSGLIYTSFKKHGIQMPRSSTEQGRVGKFIASKNHLRYGDLVFFHMDWNRRQLVNHVGIYLDNNQFIHVSSSKGCIISHLDSDYWEASFLFGTRVW